MIVRVRSESGTKRVEVPSDGTVRDLVLKINAVCSPTPTLGLYLSPHRAREIGPLDLGKKLGQLPICHGDMIYMEPRVPTSPVQGAASITPGVQEDEVDQALSKKDGKIHRPRDPHLCHHGDNNKCLNCAPLEPFDSAYLASRDPPIKFLSFHSYLHKLTSGIDKGKFVSLEDLSCVIRPGCTDHSPWPEGICTKCQPSAVTLARQSYRHVDNIMFEDGAIVNRFIEGWRQSGRQRVGFLYGRFEEYTEVPLGIKAVVVAIYEPPQISSPLEVELMEDQEEETAVSMVAKHLGLQKVGWIFTDLEPRKNGKVAYKRHIDTFFMSAQECIMAADLQNKHPNPCRLAPSGSFGSKFVTVCVSGDEQENIHLSGYQVSNQCMALVRDGCLVPTLDAPELGYIRDSSQQQYVPDVFYKSTNEYGSEVTKLARPLPVEYLLLEVTTTTPLEPCPSLPGGKNGDPFPIENREFSNHKPDFQQLAVYYNQQSVQNFALTVADFHLLLYLYKCDVVPLKEATLELCTILREKDDSSLSQWRLKDPWVTVDHLIRATVSSPSIGVGPPAFPVPSGGPGQWHCQHCTYLNTDQASECEVCQLPRN